MLQPIPFAAMPSESFSPDISGSWGIFSLSMGGTMSWNQTPSRDQGMIYEAKQHGRGRPCEEIRRANPLSDQPPKTLK